MVFAFHLPIRTLKRPLESENIFYLTNIYALLNSTQSMESASQPVLICKQQRVIGGDSQHNTIQPLYFTIKTKVPSAKLCLSAVVLWPIQRRLT